MNLSKIFIERPVATLSLTLALVVFGWFAYFALPVAELPNVDFATITVTANLPGADPETMASTVAAPLEKQFSNIPSIDGMNSTNSLGQTVITLQFDLNRNIDAAAEDVQNAISQAQRVLPSEMTTPPTLRKVNPASSPILYLTLTADHLPLTTLDEFAETQLGQRLSMISGVAQVLVYGSQTYAVRIGLNPQALQARGMDINDAILAIQKISSHQPSGTLQTTNRNYLLKTDAQLHNASEFNRAIIAYQNGMPIRLENIGVARDSTANDQQATWYNHKRAIVLAVQRQADANTVDVIQKIKNVLPALEKDLPGDAHLKIFYDRSNFIKSSIQDVKLSLLLAIALVALVILIFLSNGRATVIAILALPTSLLGTFGIMYWLGFSLDNLSLMAMVLAVGFVVDDAIVVIENIVRYLEKGYQKLESALRGSREIGFTILSMTISLAAVFIPILFMGGLIGRLFSEFAVVVGVAVLLSGLISLTLTPLLCSRLLKNHLGDDPQKKIFPWFEKTFELSKSFYEKSLRLCLAHKKWVVVGAASTVILTGILFLFVNKGFIPQQDSGLIFGNTEVPIGVTFNEFSARQGAIANILEQDPNIAAVISNVGQGTGPNGSSNTGRLQIRLKPTNQRPLSADKIIQELRKKMDVVPGIKVYLQNPAAIRAGGAVTKSTYQYVLQSTNWQSLKTISVVLQEKMSKIAGIQDVNSDLQITNPEISLHILRDKAAQLGISPSAIETTLYNAFGQHQISTIYTATDQYEVIAGIDTQNQLDPTVLNNLLIRSNDGKLVTLSAIAALKYGAGPVSINHYNQLPAVILSFNLVPGASLGKIADNINTISKQILPADVSGGFIGSALAFQQSIHTLPILLLITIFVIYIVLAILYEHFGHPLTILTALPFAGFGALLMLMLFHRELDIFSFVGIIMLVGLVKKNGIMMVDFALEAKRKENLSSTDAIVKACTIRFRPIMMTTMAAIFGALPMALGFGAGGETRQVMGIAVVGGLLFSQMITLYVTPVFYVYMERWTEKIKVRFKKL